MMTNRIGSADRQLHRRVAYRSGQALLLLAAASAVLAAIVSMSDVQSASDATRMVEIWRCVGLATFAIIFVALAHRPDTSPLVWFAVIGNKLALTVLASTWLSGRLDGVSSVLAWDLGLTIVLVIAAALTHMPPTKPRQELP